MSTYLDAILQRTREDLHGQKRRSPLASLKEMPGYHAPRRPFELRLRGASPAVIAEIKAASPSRGVIREHLDVAAIARSYVEGGAAAISVLTDEPFFKGKLEYMPVARAGHTIPVLRKDFIIDPYQLHQARAYEADAVLLIVAGLERQELLDLKLLADELGLEVLVEVHSEPELETLSGGDFRIVGINNRDLSTFVTDMQTSIRMRPLIRKETVCVSESGIQTGTDIRSLQSHGIGAFLIGESLMRTTDPGDTLRRLLDDVRGPFA
jgi:indole-3-glycerol phosphate synthase